MSETTDPTTGTDDEFKGGAMSDDTTAATTTDAADAVDANATGTDSSDSAASNSAENAIDTTNAVDDNNVDSSAKEGAADNSGATDSAETERSEEAEPLDEFAESVNFSIVFDDDDEDDSNDGEQSPDDEDDNILMIDDAIVLDEETLIDNPYDSDPADDDIDESLVDLAEAIIETGSSSTDEDASDNSAKRTDSSNDVSVDADQEVTSETAAHDLTGREASASSNSGDGTDAVTEVAHADSSEGKAETQSEAVAETTVEVAEETEKETAGARTDNTDVVDSNAAHVNETLSLAVSATNDEETTPSTDATLDAPRLAAEHSVRASRRRTTASTVSSRIDRELRNKEDAILLKSNPTFAFDAVSYRNRKSGRDVVDQLNLAFQAGGVYAVLIPDDDDELRTTLVGLMSGMLYPTSGSVMNKSANYMQYEQSELRGHRVGVIPQIYAVREKLTALDNIVYTMDASGRTFLKPKKVLARELLASVGLGEESFTTVVSKLPTIDQRRVAIARAICCEATIIVADEPADGLNDEECSTILDVLHTIAHGDPQRCVIIVTSDEAVAEITDRVVEL